MSLPSNTLALADSLAELFDTTPPAAKTETLMTAISTKTDKIFAGRELNRMVITLPFFEA
jgi:hypothetical protein